MDQIADPDLGNQINADLCGCVIILIPIRLCATFSIYSVGAGSDSGWQFQCGSLQIRISFLKIFL